MAAAGLIHSSDVTLRIRRQRKGGEFYYTYPSGRQVRSAAVLQRIQSLVIPPAWTEVSICDRPTGHIQAIGRDARGRKQYRYHARWRQRRDHEKFSRLLGFARALPRIRRRVRRDLRQRGLGKTKALAAVVRLLELSRIRVGNDEYARQNQSFGLTTLRNRHVCLRGPTMRFQFLGKSGRRHCIQVREPRLARVVARCLRMPGRDVFQYRDDEGRCRRVSAADVNHYLREISGGDFTAKDFRTWAGTVLAVDALRGRWSGNSGAAPSRREINGVIREVASHLGNTPAVCRKSYVHPDIIDAFLTHGPRRDGRARKLDGLRTGEVTVLRLLRRESVVQDG